MHQITAKVTAPNARTKVAMVFDEMPGRAGVITGASGRHAATIGYECPDVVWFSASVYAYADSEMHKPHKD